MNTQPQQPAGRDSNGDRHVVIVGCDEVADILRVEVPNVRISVCAGLSDSMEKLRGDLPQLVVCGLDGDGWQLTPLIRKAQNAQVPVLAVASDEQAMAAVRAARWAIDRSALLSILEVAERLLEDPSFVPDPERYPPPRRAGTAIPPTAQPSSGRPAVAAPPMTPASASTELPASWMPQRPVQPAPTTSTVSREDIAELQAQLSRLEASAESAKQWSVKRMDDAGRRLEEAGRRLETLEQKLASLGRLSVLEAQLTGLAERIQELSARGDDDLLARLDDAVHRLTEGLRQSKTRVDAFETELLRGEQQRREWEEGEATRAKGLEDRVRRVEDILLATERATREQSTAVERFSTAMLSRIEALETLFAASERHRLDRASTAARAAAPIVTPAAGAAAPRVTAASAAGAAAPHVTAASATGGGNGASHGTPVGRDGSGRVPQSPPARDASGRVPLPPPGVQQKVADDDEPGAEDDRGAAGDSETLRQLRASLARLQDAWAGESDKKR